MTPSAIITMIEKVIKTTKTGTLAESAIHEYRFGFKRPSSLIRIFIILRRPLTVVNAQTGEVVVVDCLPDLYVPDLPTCVHKESHLPFKGTGLVYLAQYPYGASVLSER